MGRNARKGEEKKSGGEWVGTFNDMVTLLLTFFVLILSLSKLNVAKVKEASYSFSSACGFMESGELIDVDVFKPFVPVENKVLKSREAKDELVERINELEGIYAVVVEEGVLASMKEKVLFETGLADIKEGDHPLLKGLASILQKADCQIRVEGHTDDVPIHNERFSSNWDLSVARAVTIVRYFASPCGIPPERLSAAGYGDSKPLFPNRSDSGRDRNRRVEIMLTLQDEVQNNG